jgi:hypothetical protein
MESLGETVQVKKGYGLLTHFKCTLNKDKFPSGF